MLAETYAVLMSCNYYFVSLKQAFEQKIYKKSVKTLPGWGRIIPVEIASLLPGTVALLDGVGLPISKALGLVFPGVSEADLGGHRRYQTSLAASSGDGFPGWRRGGAGASCPCPHLDIFNHVPSFAALVGCFQQDSETTGNKCVLHSGCHVINSVKNNSQSACVTNSKRELGVRTPM